MSKERRGVQERDLHGESEGGHDGDERSPADLHAPNDSPGVLRPGHGDVVQAVREQQLVEDAEGAPLVLQGLQRLGHARGLSPCRIQFLVLGREVVSVLSIRSTSYALLVRALCAPTR